MFGKSTTRRLRPSDERITTRVVKDRRWIHRNQLEIGMYVCELDKPWEETRFIFQGFEIDSMRTLKAVQEASEYLCIETEKVAMVSSNSSDRLCAASRTRRTA